MTVFNLAALVLAMAVFPLIKATADRTAHSPLRAVLCIWLLLVLVSGWAAVTRGELRRALALVRARERRGPFLAVMALTGLNGVVASQAHGEAAPQAHGAPWEHIFGLALTIFASQVVAWWPTPGERRGERRGPPAVQLALVVLASIVMVAYPLLRTGLPERMELLAALWGVSAVLQMHLVRTYFYGAQSVPTAGFLFFRTLPLLLGALLLVELSGEGVSAAPRALWVQAWPLLPVATVAVVVAWYQYDCLREYTLRQVVWPLLLTPPVTLVLHCLRQAQAPGVGEVLWVLAVVLLFAAASFPFDELRRRTPWQVLSSLYHRFREDPAVYLTLHLPWRPLCAMVLAALWFQPWLSAEAPDLQWVVGHLWALVLVLVCLLLALAMQSRMLGRMLELLSRAVSEKAHDLKGPFATVRGLHELLRHEAPISPGQLRQYLEQYAHEFQLAEALLRGLLDRELAHRALHMKLEPLDLLAFLAERRETLFTLQMKGRGELRLDAPGVRDCVLPIDRQRLTCLLYDLTINSIQAWKQAGRGAISGLRIGWALTLTADRVELRVTDNGPGMDGPVARTAGEAWLSTKSGGTGLGLFLGRRYIEGHRGTFAMSNRKEGGCQALIQLPLPTPEDHRDGDATPALPDRG